MVHDSPVKDELIGAVVDGWRILMKVGQGASGSVYEARKEDQRAALKMIRPDVVSPSSLARFKREAHLLMEIDHPHVVGCLSAGETDEFIYLALEFLEGGSLDQYLLRKGKFSEPNAVWVALGLLEGLGAIHGQGIVHRDVKPGNVLLDGVGVIKLADFNLARSEAIDMQVTTDGTIIGTPFYMAPEQVEGKDISPSCDLYAVGAMLYRMIAGHPPYEGTSSLSILQKHMHEDLPDLCAECPEVDPRVGAAVQALMAKSPEDRPADAEAAKALFEGLPCERLKVEKRRPRRRRPGGKTTGARRPPSGKSTSSRRVRPGGGKSTSSRRSPVRHPPGSRRPPPRPASARSVEETQDIDIDQLQADIRKANEEKQKTRESGLHTIPTTGRAKRLGPVVPLPKVARSRLFDLFVLLVLLLATVHLVDLGLRKLGDRPIDALRTRLEAELDHGTALRERSSQGLGVLLSLRKGLDAALIPWLAFVAFLVFDRLLAHLGRVGLLWRIVLRFKARSLVRSGEIHAAAKLHEQRGDRLKAGQLLSQSGMHILAAELYRLGGYTELQAEALVAGDRGSEALRVVNESSADITLAAKLGDTSRESAKLLVDRGLVDDAITAHAKAGRHYDAAELLETEGRIDEAIKALEAGYRTDKGREYWHYTKKSGVLEDAKPKLARRIAKLFLDAGNKAGAAGYYEKAGELDRAIELFVDAGDARGRARCLMVGIPPKGKLGPKHLERLREAARALGDARDPKAVDLFVRAGEFARAGEIARAARDYPHAAELFARAGRHSDGADCAAKAGNRQLSAFLLSEGGEFNKAAALYEQLGKLDEAAECAGKTDDAELKARLFGRVGDLLGQARILVTLKREAEAVAVIAKIPKDSPTWDESRVLVADIHHGAGRHKQAAQGYAEGLYPELHLREEVAPTLRYVKSLEELSRFDEALKVLDRFKDKKFAPRDIGKRRQAIQQKTGRASGPKDRKTTGGKPRPAKPRPSSDGSLANVRRADELLGKSLDRYEIQELLGEGHFLWIFKARHKRLNRTTALKVLRPHLNTEGAGKAFLNEGKALVGKENPHLIEIFDGGEVRGLCFLAYEFVSGPNLEQLLAAEGPLAVGRSARLGAGILAALSLAHRNGVIHHDLKPSRVMVGAGSVAKVADFGVAKVFEERDGSASFLDPRYSSPEQARGENAGQAADQYAAGLIIYKMLSGKLPFVSKSPRGFWALHATAAPQPLGELCPELPPPLVKAVMRSLSKDPADRFPKTEAFEKAVAAFIRRGPRAEASSS
jgi:serine/threonine protein kinase